MMDAERGPALPAREAYADVPGARIWYVDTGGSGLPVVFMHAATGSSRVWEHQMPAFTQAGYRVIAHDRAVPERVMVGLEDMHGRLAAHLNSGLASQGGVGGRPVSRQGIDS